MASAPATVDDFRGLSDAEVHHYATVALEALRERAVDLETRLYVDRARRHVAEVAELFEDGRYGHCDTCGALCDSRGCAADRSHVAALE